MVLLGLVAICHVRHVYAADRFSIMLLSDVMRETDDITLQLRDVGGNSVMRESDPPLLALRMFDPTAADGRAAAAPGPCPVARRFVERLIREAACVVAHVPIVNRRGWLDSLTAGCIETGELYLLPHPLEPPDGELIGSGINQEWQLSRQLLAAGHAHSRSA